MFYNGNSARPDLRVWSPVARSGQTRRQAAEEREHDSERQAVQHPDLSRRVLPGRQDVGLSTAQADGRMDGGGSVSYLTATGHNLG